MANIPGTPNDDTFTGTDGDDSITGAGGNDSISALGGDDTVEGGEGNDTIDGGTAADTLTGDAGNDDITGAEGNDTIVGGAGNDTLVGDGGSANDTSAAPAPGAAPPADFSNDPGWTEINNTGPVGSIVYQPNSFFASNDPAETGEVGGVFSRDLTDPNGVIPASNNEASRAANGEQPYYVKEFDQTYDQTDSFEFSSLFWVSSPAGAEALVGFFNTNTPGQ
ncbi:MAG: calcium-binding protein, partial [Shimia sp.]